MIPKELFKKVRRIEITTSRLVTDIFAGQYHSVFKGQGIEFDEVREYQQGDDIRTIDWNVTAKTGRPHVKKFIEERELTVIIMVDASASSRFGTVDMLKSQLAAELAATLAFAATRNNDRVGLIIFTNEIEHFIPPRKGIQHVLRIVREILYFKPKGRATDIVQVLEYLNKVTTRKSIAFLVSDFLSASPKSSGREDELKKALSIANKRHDLIAVVLNDPREFALPEAGIVALKDTETGEVFYVDTSSPQTRRQYAEHNAGRAARRAQLFKSIGMDSMEVATDVPFSEALVRFFKKRTRKRFL